MRSRLCVRQFKAEGLRDGEFAKTPDTFFIKYLLAKATSCKDFGLLLVDISVAFMHARTDEEIYVKVISGIKSSRFLRLTAAVNGTRKASKHYQEFSCDKLVTNMLFQQNDVNPCIYKRFCDILDLEQHGDDFLVNGSTSNFEVLADEFKNNLMVKKAEIVSLKPEHQNEIHFLKRRISVDNFGWHVELDQRYAKRLLHAMVMNHGKSMATNGSKGQVSSRNVADLTEKLDPQEHREFRSGAGICQKMTEQRFDIAFSTKEIMREAAGPTTASQAKLEENRALLQRTSAMCTEFPFSGKAGRRHPCDRGRRLGWRSKHKVLHVWWSVGNRSVLHSSTSVCDTGNSIAVLSRVRGPGDHEGLH